ncbi:EamA family transporter [Staphylococcus aureus]|uniref:EamA family transporter n=1 Tax=Staphylococcus aureus TaxID=1280 RepID=UPI0039A16026
MISLAVRIIKKITYPRTKRYPCYFYFRILWICDIYHTALNFGETLISAGISGILVSTTPIFSSALAYIFLKEHFFKMELVKFTRRIYRNIHYFNK